MSKQKYKVKAGKEKANVNGIILEDATQEQLKYFFQIGHPYILTNNEQKTAANKSEQTDKPDEEA